MGTVCSRDQQMVLGHYYVPCKILIVGLNGVGKTTLLYKMKNQRIAMPEPTQDYNVETIVYRNFSFTLWDIGAQNATHDQLKSHQQETAAIIYVVDSVAVTRLEETRKHLEMVLANDEISGIPLLVLANKQDLPEALPLQLLIEALILTNQTRPWQIVPTSAITFEGVREGMDWLISVFLTPPSI